MKTYFFYSIMLIILSVHTMNAQEENPINYLRQLPKNLELDKAIIRSYQMTTDYYDFDLKSNFSGKRRITGIITYGPDENSAQWKDVYFSESKNSDETFPQGKKIAFLQHFKYQPTEKVLTTDFFKNHLPEADPFVMNLIWDALAFESLAYCCWDSLKLNEEFRAKEINSKMEIANIGTFENKDITITWLGVTEINNEICAILKYSVMNNPLDVTFENTSMKGRSHYWGEIYVSLSDKQIEYATLTEDVLTDVKLKNQPEHIIGYTVRTIYLSKFKN